MKRENPSPIAGMKRENPSPIAGMNNSLKNMFLLDRKKAYGLY